MLEFRALPFKVFRVSQNIGGLQRVLFRGCLRASYHSLKNLFAGIAASENRTTPGLVAFLAWGGLLLQA